MAVSEFKQICEKLLDCQKEEWRQEKYWSHFMTEERIIRLNAFALCFIEEQPEDANYIFRKIMETIHVQRKKQNTQYHFYELTLYNLVRCLFIQGQLEACNQLNERGMKSRNGRLLPRFMLMKARLKLKMEGDLDSSKYYGKLAYWWSNMYFPKYADIITSFCHDLGVNDMSI